MVGVPCLALCAWGASALMTCRAPSRRRAAMTALPGTAASRKATTKPATRLSMAVGALLVGQRGDDLLHLHGPRALDQDRVSRRHQPADGRCRFFGAGEPADGGTFDSRLRGLARYLPADLFGQLPDRHQQPHVRIQHFAPYEPVRLR